MRRMPIPCRRSFQPGGMSRRVLCGIRPSFPGLFPGRGQVAYVLLTSAPVAIGVIAHPMMPLDLHVLSLSLAFILSQDQTLRCCMSCLSLQKKNFGHTADEPPARGSLPIHCVPRVSESERGHDCPLFSCTTYSLLQHFNDLPAAPASKKSLTRLASREADGLQRYNRFLT